MNSDPFYQQIIERLNKKLDPDVFEQCVTDILRDTYPGLVPVPGGQDSGIDGEIADGKSEPFPLIATTQGSVIANLTKSLKAYLQGNGHRRQAVLVTSQFLTPRRRKNLFDRASELGFTLVNIHIRDDIANRLYSNPKWCKELLNLTGRPSALSVFPKSDRLILNQKLIGRDEDYKWLLETKGDRLLIGQPGSGKSYLLHRYSLDGNGLFVVDEDREAIANGIRLQEPSVLIVDDAQIHLPLISDIKQIRHELRADFSILASCWIGDQNTIKDSMNLTSTQTHELELLTRSQIVDVIYDAGLGGPESLIHEIVNQSSGRPGLAATLTQLSLQGGMRDVLLGDILSNSIRRFFEPKFGSRIIDIMAAFSVGGETGMKMQDIAAACQLSIIDVHRMVTELGAGGVLWETFDDYLSIHPYTLRHALVRDVFYNPKFSLPIHSFISYSPSLDETVRTLIGARYRGAQIRDNYLTKLLEQTQFYTGWIEYAFLGREEAAWVLRYHPELAIKIAHPALIHIPKLAIQKLFELSIGDRRPLHSSTDHPLRIIEDWVKQALPGSIEVLVRRNLLITAAIEWLYQGNDEEVGFQAIQSAYIPIYQNLSTGPGNDNVVTIRQAYLLPAELSGIQDRWMEVIDAAKIVKRIPWKSLKEIVHSWSYPELHGINLSASTRKSMRSFAERVLIDIVTLDQASPALLRWGKQIAKDANLNVPITLNQEFKILYPIEDKRNWTDQDNKALGLVKELASSWCKLKPAEVARKISQLEKDAISHEIRWPRYTPLLCNFLSDIVDDLSSWAIAFIDNNCSNDLVLPFLRKLANINDHGWKDLIHRCMDQEELIPVAISITLTTDNSSERLLEKAISHLPKFLWVIKSLCLRREIPDHILKKLLLHDDCEVACATAEGIWFGERKKSVQPSLEKEWLEAVIHSNDEHFLASVLENNSNLSFKWLNHIIEQDRVEIFEVDDAVRVAAKALASENKNWILEQIPADYKFLSLIENLIGDDLNLYAALLKDERLAIFHLVPLNWVDGENWISKAKLAIEKGYSAEQIANAAYGYPTMAVTWAGDELNVKRDWVIRFERLCRFDDERIQEIGNIGKKYAEEKLKVALDREKKIEIFGHRNLYS